MDIGRRPLFAAENGRPGQGNHRTGRRGKDLIVEVPAGTIVREVVPGADPRKGPVLADLSRSGETLVAARGGKGGRGNKAFATPTCQAPRAAEEGGPATERRLYLELKLLADVGLIGLPNAGKSTLLACISAATPKIADYPFTTLHPNLGIMPNPAGHPVTLADIPGLIHGPSRGAGLGDRFLEALDVVRNELRSYSPKLAAKRSILLLTKADRLSPRFARALLAELHRRGVRPLPVSAHSGAGLNHLKRAILRDLDALPDPPPPPPLRAAAAHRP
jgi:GTP-binding protein